MTAETPLDPAKLAFAAAVYRIRHRETCYPEASAWEARDAAEQIIRAYLAHEAGKPAFVFDPAIHIKNTTGYVVDIQEQGGHLLIKDVYPSYEKIKADKDKTSWEIEYQGVTIATVLKSLHGFAEPCVVVLAGDSGEGIELSPQKARELVRALLEAADKAEGL